MFIVTWVMLLFISSSSASLEMSGKPTLMIPLLTEGQETTLTCIADLCSNEETPVFVWKWTRSMENNSLNINNVTESQTQKSTVTFAPSAKHHGSAVTCQVTCPNNITANVTNVLSVTYVKKLQISGEKTLKDGDTLNLTCCFDGFPQTVLIWTKLGSNTSITNGTGAATLFMSNVTGKDSGQYICTAQNQDRNLTVDIAVRYVKTPTISGKSTIKQDESLNLTCTVDSFPLSVIIWSKRGLNKTLNNETKYGTSTLVIHNVTKQHSGQYFCYANHLNKTLEQDINITVINAWEMKITGEPTVREGSALNLTCSVESFHPLLITWTKLGTNKTLTNETGIKVGTSSLIIQNVTISNSGQYFCTTKFLTSQIQDINVTVTYRRRPKITGDIVVTEGHVLNLTCSFDSWPLSLITWTKSRSSTVLKNDTGSATLLIFNTTAEDRGLYICTSEHLNISFTEEVHIKVKMQPQILDKSGCKSQQDVLTCVCISQGFPSPTITWESLENHVDYSINTVVSNHTVTSTISINMKGLSNISAVCISSNTNGKTRRNLSRNEVEDGHIVNYLRTFTQMGTIIPFLIGVLVSAFIFSLLWLCYRKKHKSRGSTSETIEMVMTQETNGGHTVDYEPILARGTAGGSSGPEAGTSDIEYSDIHLLIKQDIASPSEMNPQKEVTEYAKINPQKKSKMEEGEGREGDQEMKLCVPEAEESETVAVYSNVTKLKDQM
ncbi:sialic acid-binding Ig-like lectin 11 isoform X1 [Xiphophorus couchianus]|uniref:sialic acid-binding Ig-like lectin 11 isoform X1 n=2 Tax=Xiphophorus couchianus TaxID=32473 RepID=UPI001016A1FD|nr:sialic acid-binding Ig-like lectin 11 isoform X1 [Xiphophorus couchianus]